MFLNFVPLFIFSHVWGLRLLFKYLSRLAYNSLSPLFKGVSCLSFILVFKCPVIKHVVLKQLILILRVEKIKSQIPINTK